MARIFLSDLLAELQQFGDLTNDNGNKTIDAKAKAFAAQEAANAKQQSDIGLADALAQLKADLDAFAYPAPESIPTPAPDPDNGPSAGPDPDPNIDPGFVVMGGPLFPNRPKLLDFVRVRRNLTETLVAKGVDRASAENVVGKLGDGHIIDLLVKYGPSLLAIAKAIALMFGIVLPF